MPKKNVKDLKISCKNCGETLDTVGGIISKIDNEWDSEASWVKQRLEQKDIGVFTHLPLHCTTCLDSGGNPEKITTVKIIFDEEEERSIIEW